MKRFIAFGLSLSICSTSWGAFAKVNTTEGNGGVSPNTQAFGFTSTAGNLLVCGVQIVDNTKVVSSVVSNAVSGLKNFVQATNAACTNSILTALFDIWFLYNAGSATSVMTTATASIGGIICFEYSGGGTANSFDSANHANNLAVAATLTGPSMTTGTTGELIFAGVSDSNSAVSANAPYNTDFLATGTGHGASDHITTTIVTNETVVFNDSSTGGGCVAAAMFCPSGGCATAASSSFNSVFSIKGGKLTTTGSKMTIK